MSRATILRLADHTVRIWRAVTGASAMGVDRRSYQLVTETRAKVNRDTAPTGDVGPGMDTIGRRRLYLPPEIDARHRDIVELVEGPDAPQTWEIDENGTRPRGHHLQLDCIEWRGTLPEVES